MLQTNPNPSQAAQARQATTNSADTLKLEEADDFKEWRRTQRAGLAILQRFHSNCLCAAGNKLQNAVQ